MSRHFSRLLVFTFVLILIQACSAGGGETGTGISKDNNVSVGVITGFGSVYVNGIKYETSSNTQISVDGDSTALESQLAVGMLVTLSGNINADGTTGVASSITFEDNVEGPVLEINRPAIPPATGSILNVLGQNVSIDSDTIFDSKDAAVKTIDQISKGQIVQVSGFSNGDGNIYATRVELKAAAYKTGDEIEIKGIATEVTSTSFKIGNMTVSYSQQALETIGSVLNENDFVEVKSEVGLENGILIAKVVEFKNERSYFEEKRENQEIELAGIINQLNLTNRTFLLNAEKLFFTDLTEYENGDVSDLQNNTKVKIEGHFNALGEIIVEAIIFKEESDINYKGLIQSINLDERTFTILGVTIKVTNLTRLKDDLDNEDTEYDQQYFSFANLSVGDYVEVDVFTDGERLVAGKLERKNDESALDAAENEMTEKPDGEGNTAENQGIERSLKGLITGLDLVNKIIFVSQVEIDISSAKINDESRLQLGAVVEVQGFESVDGLMAIELNISEIEQAGSEINEIEN